ncbi:MAG: hypothetical protein HFJ55_03460 [Clostridia bacterium]|nr:hypothetical protein [Clostridia bacterium]
MQLIGIVGNKKDIQSIKKSISIQDHEIIEINEKSIKNLQNIKFDEIILLKGIKLPEEEYEYMRKLISNVEYLIINADIKELGNIETEKPIKLITFGFNSKATITISSIKEDKIIICLQRNIKKFSNKIIEAQEKEIEAKGENGEKIYNKLVVFIINELHNL